MADAILYDIEGRTRERELEWAKLEDFHLGNARAVSPQRVVDEPGWTPYCVDHPNRQMLFVQVPPEVDYSQSVFVHLDQYKHAQRVIQIPYDELEAIAEQVAPPEALVFLLNMPRSGTTLISQLFNQVEGVWSLSEPDIYSTLSLLRPFDNNDEDIKMLLKHSTRLLFRPPSLAQAHTFVLKPRSQALFIADLLHDVYPDAKYVFLYRDGLSASDSFYRMVARARPDLDIAMINRPEAEVLWSSMVIQPDASYLENLLNHDLEEFPFEEFLAAMYCIQCEQYLQTYQQGIPYYALRYNELNNNREQEIINLLRHCGLPSNQLAQVIETFEKDSQEGTAIARDIEVPSFSPEQKARFYAAIAQHPSFQNPDILLPDIYHPERIV